ncbi:MAG: hypothetical protein J6Y77_04845, partial [Paludibacteraceae bacterium]|nr:hypothetical protein [Paludibacteraceae bacterium]
MEGNIKPFTFAPAFETQGSLRPGLGKILKKKFGKVLVDEKKALPLQSRLRERGRESEREIFDRLIQQTTK